MDNEYPVFVVRQLLHVS